MAQVTMRMSFDQTAKLKTLVEEKLIDLRAELSHRNLGARRPELQREADKWEAILSEFA